MTSVDLSKNKPQNIEYMLNQITEKLRMVNTSAVKAEAINEELYEELCEIYEMVMKKNTSLQTKWKLSPKSWGDCENNAFLICYSFLRRNTPKSTRSFWVFHLIKFRSPVIKNRNSSTNFIN